jgi:hypothetical protein
MLSSEFSNTLSASASALGWWRVPAAESRFIGRFRHLSVLTRGELLALEFYCFRPRELGNR